MALEGTFYGIMAVPSAAKGTLPPEGEFAFYIDSTSKHFSMIDSDENVTDLTDDSYSSDHSYAEGVDITLGTVTGTKFGTSTSQKLAFYGSTPAVQATALTTVLTTLVSAGTASDYAIQVLLESGAFGFKTAAEGETVIACVVNNQARIGELESKLQALGLLA